MKIEFKQGDQVKEDLLSICEDLGKGPTAVVYHLIRQYKQAQLEDAMTHDKETRRNNTNKQLL